MQQRALTAWNATGVLRCIKKKKNVGHQGEEGDCSLCSALERLHLGPPAQEGRRAVREDLLFNYKLHQNSKSSNLVSSGLIWLFTLLRLQSRLVNQVFPLI